jgi:hypothetical protein
MGFTRGRPGIIVRCTSAANDPIFRKVQLKVAVGFIPGEGVCYRLPTPVQTKKMPSERRWWRPNLRRIA